MKRNLLFILLLCGSLHHPKAQTGNNNYVRTTAPTVATTATTGLSVSNSITSYQYFDDLGRPWQTVQVGMTPGQLDLVTYQEYDAAGRSSATWLPVNAASGNNGNPLSLSTVQSRSRLSSNYGDGKAYSKPVYEASPLDRVLEQYGPGEEWHDNGKRVKTEYLSNTADGELSCRWYRTTDTRGDVQVSILTGKMCYPAGELYVTRTTDEEGTGVSLEFKDKQGHLLLTRRKNGASYHDTYYVYDSYGNLRAVLPPLAADALAAAGTWTVTTDGTGALAQYAYLYKYDDRNRCIWKKLPGADGIRYGYDRGDRMIASQDGEQAAKSPALCTFYLYDIDNRPVIQGTCEFRGSIASLGPTAMLTSLKRSYDGKIIASGLENSGYNPNMTLYSPVVHTINYYDDYGFRSLAGFDNESCFPKESHPAGGLLTGTVTMLLDGSGKKLYTVYYYDEKGRPEKTVSSNHLGGYDTTTTVYTFTGKPKTVTHVHTATGKAQQTQVYTYTYDHADRVKTVTHKLNSLTAVTLADNTYDDLGRLKKNSRNGVSSLSDTYEYNVRSWLTGISGAQHTENLTYDYNGNISSMQWRLDGTTRKYAYSYDPLSRLVSATFSGGKDAERYSTSYSYDKHGNILSLQRYGKTANSDLGVYGLADNLTMTYNGNQLTNVLDAAVTVTLPESNDFKKGSAANPGYAYDKNGNLTKDLNKKITAISYNSLYLPELLTIDGVTHKYTYAADGRKLKVVQGSTNRDYVGNIIYENGSLKRILVEGGYIEGGTYYFYFNDHLGNVRAVIDGGNHNIQFNHYYPYGLPMAETSDGKQNEQPYKYNGKEFERKNGLNWMDYGARHYDAALGRFTTMDPLAEKYYGVSPYVYCGNNPINRIDPDGKDWRVQTRYNRETKKMEYTITVNAVLYNNSSDQDIDMKQLSTSITEQMTNIYTISGEDFETEMNFNLRTVNSLDEIGERDHVIQVVDQDFLDKFQKEGKPTARSMSYGLNIEIGTELAKATIGNKNNRSIAHELGHTGGLGHLNDKAQDNYNLMRQTYYVKGNAKKAIQLGHNQIREIRDNYIHNRLKIISPVLTHRNGLKYLYK